MPEGNVECLSNKTDAENFPSAQQEDKRWWNSLSLRRPTGLKNPNAEKVKKVQKTLYQNNKRATSFSSGNLQVFWSFWHSQDGTETRAWF